MIGAWSQWTEEKSNMFANPKVCDFFTLQEKAKGTKIKILLFICNNTQITGFREIQIRRIC